MQIVYKRPHELTPYAQNTKKHDQRQIDNVAESIRQFGFVQPIVIDKDGVVVIGHCRLLASKQLGLHEVPCLYVDTLTEEQVRALRIADNKTNESDWDEEMLRLELPELDFFGFDFDFGLTEEEPEIIEDDPPEVDEEAPPITQPGDLWILGRHRLLCGDSTDPEAINKLMELETADLVITDPPYNVAYEGKTKDRLTIQNDQKEDADFYDFLCKAFRNLDAHLKPGGAFYIWHADSEGLNFRKAAKTAGWTVRQCLVWNKNVMVMGRQDYQWKHEPCLYGWKDGAGHFFIDDRTQTTVYEDKGIDLKKLKKTEMLELLKDIFADKVSSTVINEDRPSRSAEHPTMKPVKLIGRLIKNSSQQGESVLDTFGGSGSTMIACEQLGRTSYTCELDPKYCDVIVKRWEKFTGKKAERREAQNNG